MVKHLLFTLVVSMLLIDVLPAQPKDSVLRSIFGPRIKTVIVGDNIVVYKPRPDYPDAIELLAGSYHWKADSVNCILPYLEMEEMYTYLPAVDRKKRFFEYFAFALPASRYFICYQIDIDRNSQEHILIRDAVTLQPLHAIPIGKFKNFATNIKNELFPLDSARFYYYNTDENTTTVFDAGSGSVMERFNGRFSESELAQILAANALWLYKPIPPAFPTLPEPLQPVLETGRHLGRIQKCLFSSDGKEVVTGSWDKTVRIWDAATGEVKRTIRIPQYEGLQGMVYAMALSKDMRHLAVAGYSCGVGTGEYVGDYILLYDYRSGALLDMAFPHTQAIFSLAFSDDGAMLASGGGDLDGMVYLHTVSDDRLTTVAGVKVGALVSQLVFIPRTKRLIAGAATTASAFLIEPPVLTASGAVKTPVQAKLIGRSFWASMTGNTVCNDITVTPNGKLVYLASTMGVEFLPTDPKDEKSKGLYVKPFSLAPYTVVRLSPDGKRLAVASGNIVQVYPVDAAVKTSDGILSVDSSRIVRFSYHDNAVLDLNFSPDGKSIISSGGESYQAAVWDAETGAVRCELGGRVHSTRIHALATSRTSASKIAIGYHTGSDSLDIVFDLASLQISSNADRNDFETADQQRARLHRPAVQIPKDDPLSIAFGRTLYTYQWVNTDDYVLSTEFITIRQNSRTMQVTPISYRGIPARSIVSDKDGYYFFIGYDDGQIDIVERYGFTLVATLYIGPDREWVLFKPDGYYAASSKGARAMAWLQNPWVITKEFASRNTPENRPVLARTLAISARMGGGCRFYPFEQFDIALNQPAMISKLFGAPFSTVCRFAALTDQRYRRMGFDRNAVKNSLVVPTVRITAPVAATTPKRMTSISLTCASDSATLRQLLVYANGVPVFGTGGIDLRPKQSRTVQQSIVIPLEPGRNKLQFSCRDGNGMESLTRTEYVFCTAPLVVPDVYVLTIGVGRYAQKDFDLTYAAKDAGDVAALYRGHGRSGPLGTVRTMTVTDSTATREGILAAGAFLRQAKTEDLVIVHMASHGVFDDSYNYFLGTTDMDFTAPSARGLSFREFESLFDGIAARRKLVLVDACHSGEVDRKDAASAPVSATIAATGVRTRGFKMVTQHSTSGNRFEATMDMMNRFFSDIRKGTGAVIISAAGGKEFAFESEKWNNGVFTYSLLKGLRDKAADTNGDGTVVVSELRDYIIRSVAALTDGQQTPTSRAENLDLDFSIW